MRKKVVNIVSLDTKVDVKDNYALQCVAKHYHLQGWKVITDPQQIGKSTLTYLSLIFTKSRKKAEPYQHLPNVHIGGTGWDISSKLPPEIEAVKPKLNYGFTTRGCNRTCGFCFVPEKEGRFHVVGDLYDLWNGIEGVDIKLLDNNILYDHDHFRTICEQAKKHKLRLDFNQGLDFRLFTNESVKALKGVRLPPRLRFALDNKGDEEAFLKKLPTIHKVCKSPLVYVLVGYNTSLAEDLNRLDFISLLDCRPYVMKHDNVTKDPEYSLLATYVNSNVGYFPAMTFTEFKAYMEQRQGKPKAFVQAPEAPLRIQPYRLDPFETVVDPETGTTYQSVRSTGFGINSVELINNLADECVDLVFTDPPYNKNVATWDKKHNPQWFLEQAGRIIKNGGSILVWCGQELLVDYINYCPQNLTFRQIIHWAKTNPHPVNQSEDAIEQGKFRRYCYSVEYLLWFTKGDFYTFNPNKIPKEFCGGNRKDVYTASQVMGKTERVLYEDGKTHPCQKPLKLIKAILEVHSNKGDSVFDPYAGTGVVAEACIKTGRKILMADLQVELAKPVSARLDNKKHLHT